MEELQKASTGKFENCTKKELILMVLTAEEEREAMHLTIQDQRYAIEFIKKLAASKGSANIGAYAKMLCNDGFDIGQQRLYGWLRNNGFLLQDNSPKQKYVKQNLFEVTTGPVQGSSSGRVWTQTKITPKGMLKITPLLEKSEEFNKGA